MDGRASDNHIEGTVSSVLFRNEENGYTILRLDRGEQGQAVVLGSMPGVMPGEFLEVDGSWTYTEPYGERFKAESMARKMPEGEKEIYEFLASGAIKGIRAGTARRLLDAFGTETLNILENEPEKLTKIKGMSPKRASEIQKSYREQMGIRCLADFLSEYHLPLSAVMPLYRRFGDYSMDMILQNPYVLSDRMLEVPFYLVDSMALQMGVRGDDPQRMEAALNFELDHNVNNGHVFLPENKLMRATSMLIGVSEESLAPCLENLIDTGEIIREKIAGVTACYPADLYEAECYVAMRLSEMCQMEFRPPKHLDRMIGAIEQEQGITYADQQRKAVEMAASRQVMLLTGGPGTGKTTSLRGILALFDAMGMETALTAPTGRAAKKMGDTCGKKAFTIHRLLEAQMNLETGQLFFAKDQDSPLPADAVIVDETSMVDIALMSALLAALRSDCRLVLVGDPDQLPSVGPGIVLDHLLRSQVIPSVCLTEIFRQAQESAIVMNAHEVNRGIIPKLDNRNADFFCLKRNDAVRTVDTIVELCLKRLPENMGIPPDQIQVLSPTRKNGAGTTELNRALQNALNPHQEGKKEQVFGRYTFREGDRVMQIKNNYDIMWENHETGEKDIGVFNGDIGTILRISGEGVMVSFDGREALYSTQELNELEPAYAVTVHKSQGSEYRAVILSLCEVSPNLLVRSVLYTAITRARELFIVVGEEELLNKMVENDRHARRYSALRTRLMQEQNPDQEGKPDP